MTRSAVGEFDEFLVVVAGFLFMAIDTPTHVHHLRIFSDRHLRHIAVTGFAI